MDISPCPRERYYKEISGFLLRSALPVRFADVLKIVPEGDLCSDFYAAAAYLISPDGEYIGYRDEVSGEMMVTLPGPNVPRQEQITHKFAGQEFCIPVVPQSLVEGVLMIYNLPGQRLTPESAVEKLIDDFPELILLEDQWIAYHFGFPALLSFVPVYDDAGL